MHPEWARFLREQCSVADIPFFFKQWGGFRPRSGGRTLDGQEWGQLPALHTTLPGAECTLATKRVGSKTNGGAEDNHLVA